MLRIKQPVDFPDLLFHFGFADGSLSIEQGLFVEGQYAAHVFVPELHGDIKPVLALSSAVSKKITTSRFNVSISSSVR